MSLVVPCLVKEVEPPRQCVTRLEPWNERPVHWTTPRFLSYYRVYLGGLSASALPAQRVPVVQRPRTDRGKLGGEKFTSSLGFEKYWHTDPNGAGQLILKLRILLMMSPLP